MQSAPTPRRPKPRAARGFTIVELLVVLAVVSVLTAVATITLSVSLAEASRVTAKRNAQTIANLAAVAVAGGSPVFEGVGDDDLDKALRRIKANPVVYLTDNGRPVTIHIGTYTDADLNAAKAHLRFSGGRLVYSP